jgi:hypothetical protein
MPRQSPLEKRVIDARLIRPKFAKPLSHHDVRKKSGGITLQMQHGKKLMSEKDRWDVRVLRLTKPTFERTPGDGSVFYRREV